MNLAGLNRELLIAVRRPTLLYVEIRRGRHLAMGYYELASATTRRATRRAASIAVLGAIVAVFSACADGEPRPGEEPPPAASLIDTADPLAAEPTIEGSFPVGPEGALVEILCFGEGTPTIVLEAGTDSSSIEQYPSAFVEPLAERNMTCTYSRLGTGSSDPPTAGRRTLDDVVKVLHALLEEAAVPPPYMLVGQSGGGLIAVHYAGRYPQQLAGLVLLDPGTPVPDLAKEFPGAMGWNNPEHIDWPAAERELALHLPSLPSDMPVLIVVASESAEQDDQTVWLELSSLARRVELAGGHDIHLDNTDGVIEEMQQLLTTLEAG